MVKIALQHAFTGNTSGFAGPTGKVLYTITLSGMVQVGGAEIVEFGEEVLGSGSGMMDKAQLDGAILPQPTNIYGVCKGIFR